MKRAFITLVLSAAMITLTSCSNSEASVQSPSADTGISQQTNDAENTVNSDLSNTQTSEKVELDLNAGNPGNTITGEAEPAETTETGEPEQTAEAAKGDGYPPKIYHNGKLYSSEYFFDAVWATSGGGMITSNSDPDVYLIPGGEPTLFYDLGDLTYYKNKIGRTVPIGFDETPDEELECNQGADSWADVYKMDIAGVECLLVIFNPEKTNLISGNDYKYSRFIDVYSPVDLDYESNTAIMNELFDRYQVHNWIYTLKIVRPDGRKWVYYKGMDKNGKEDNTGDWVFVTVEAGTAEE